MNIDDIIITEMTPYTYPEYIFLIKQLSPNAMGPAISNEMAVSLLSMSGMKKIFLAIDSNTKEVVGTISLILEPKVNRENVFNPKSFMYCGHIEDVVVDSSRRLCGIGRELVKYAVSYAKSVGCYKVILDCSKENIGFYEKCNLLPHETCMRINL